LLVVVLAVLQITALTQPLAVVVQVDTARTLVLLVVAAIPKTL
jgi:hypothetical protein